jgi:hypothetical protein
VVVFSGVLAAGQAGRNVVGGESGRLDHDLLTQPVLALCAGELWLVGPWLDYPRTRHHKTPLLRAPVLEGEGRAETQRSAVAA